MVVTYDEAFDPAAVSNVTVTRTDAAEADGTGVETADGTAANNAFSFRFRTPDFYTQGGNLSVSAYITDIRATGLADAPATLPPSPSPFERAEARGVHLEASNLTALEAGSEGDYGQADLTHSELLRFDVYLGDKQVNTDYGITVERALAVGSESLEAATVSAANIARTEDASFLDAVAARRAGGRSTEFNVLYRLRDADNLETWPVIANLSGRLVDATISIADENDNTNSVCTIENVNRELTPEERTADGQQTLGLTVNASSDCVPSLASGNYLVTTNGTLQVDLNGEGTGTITDFGGRGVASLNYELATAATVIAPADLAGGIAVAEETNHSNYRLDFNITDKDLTFGEGLTYAVSLNSSRVSGLLAWYDGAEPVQRNREDNLRVASGSIIRSLGLTRRPDDKDVGIYTVTWAIRDFNNPVAGGGVTGSFSLEITDVPEDPVFDFGSGMPAVASRPQVAGAEERTLEAIIGQGGFSVQWDQWNLPQAGNEHQLQLEYRLTVSENEAGGVFYHTHPLLENGEPAVATNTEPRELFGHPGDVLSPSFPLASSGAGVFSAGETFRTFRTEKISKPAGDTITFPLAELELRATDYNEGSVHNLSVLPIRFLSGSGSDMGAALTQSELQLATITYGDLPDAAIVEKASARRTDIPNAGDNTARETRNATNADNEFAIRLRTPDVWTRAGLRLSDYIERMEAGPLADPTAELPANPTPFEIAEARGAYLIAPPNYLADPGLTVTADKSEPGVSAAVAFELYLGDKQVGEGYNVTVTRKLDGGAHRCGDLARSGCREYLADR